MRRAVVTALLFALLCLGAGGVTSGAPSEAAGLSADTVPPAGSTAPAAADNGSAAQIVELYPDPAATGDRGEFVTIRFPQGANLSAYVLADDDAAVALNATSVHANGGSSLQPERLSEARTLTFSTAPALTASLTDRTVVALSDTLQLANSGERVELRRGGRVLDSARYDRATETEVYTPPETWEPLGATDRPVLTADGGTVEAFVLPDAPDRAVELLESADERVLLAGYTFTSKRAVDALAAAVSRGVRVEVLVDGSPVGGLTERGAAALDNLARAGARVRVFSGERVRYRYHHAKYAVVDDRALVTTENWKPAGLGGASSRGWAVITDQRRVVAGLVETFRADAGWNDTRPWQAFDPDTTESNASSSDYPSTFDPETLPVNRTRLLVTPDNAEQEIRSLIENAEESLDVIQVSIGDRSFPFLQAALDAAARGVEVRILLSSAWYVEEENRQLAAWLNEQAAAEDLPLSVRLADPNGAFEKIHAKGLVIDDETVVVGSINWNNNSLRNNREVALVLEGEEPAEYFGSVFERDWQGERSERDLPLGVGLAVLFGAALAVLGARRIQFGGRSK